MLQSNPITEAHSVLEDNEEDLRLLSDDLMGEDLAAPVLS